MESPLIKSHAFPPVKSERKGFIPIRSISYKKTLGKKDLELRQDMLSTMGKFTVSPLNSEYTNSPTRASTTHGFKPETPNYKPHMNSTFHKLSLSSTKNSTRKPFAGLLPNLRTPQLRSQQTFSQQHFEPQLQRMATKSAGLTAQDDYFKLLFDENRKVFRVEECEGVDEYYTDDMIMTRIYNQGFRVPEYYSTRLQHTEMQVLDEKSIRDEYRFKVPPLVSTLENTNTLAAHLLGGAWNDTKFIESVCETAQHEMKLIKAEKKELEDQITGLNKKFEAEIKSITSDFSKRFEKLQSIIKEDFIANQNDNFKYQKEIMLLKREKLNIEREIENSIPILHKVEDALFGRVLFNLETNDETLENIPNMNLRSEHMQSMKNGQIIH